MDRKYARGILKETEENYNLVAEQFSKTRFNVWEEMKFLIDYAKENDKVLDLGCGNGRLYPLLRQKGAEYHGVDFSSKLIEIAMNKYKEADFRVANALNLPFSSGFFNIVYSFAVFHHIPSKGLRIESLKEARRVLKEKGLLILTVWNLFPQKGIKMNILKNFFKKLFFLSELDQRDFYFSFFGTAKRYIHLFTKRELRMLLIESGFKVKETGVIKRNKESNFYIVAEK